MGDRTTITISMETWRALNAKKSRPGESFDDVIQDLLTNQSGGMGGTVGNASESTETKIESMKNTEGEALDGSDVKLPEIIEAGLEKFREKVEQYDSNRADERVRAARAIAKMLIDADGISKSAAQSRLLPEYKVEGQSDDTWWQRQGKDLLGEIEAVEWQSGRNEYVYRPD